MPASPHGSQGSNNPHKKPKPTQKDWADIWFGKLAKFHQIDHPASWHFSEEEVIAFLKSKVKAGEPAWKRLKIVQALITFRNTVLKSKEPRLEHIRAKLQEFDSQEKARAAGAPTEEELVGKINPREPDVIQQMRRNLRKLGKKYNTEKAYVGWVKRFMDVFTAIRLPRVSTKPSNKQTSVSRSRRTPFVIRSPPTCCSTTSISAPSRSY